MGLPTQGIMGQEFEDGAVVFFNMNDDLILALYPKAALAKDAKVSVTPPSPAEFSLGHIVKSKRDVDEVMKRAEKAGAKITDPAHDRFWGAYSGYFQDLDGHLWEIACAAAGAGTSRLAAELADIIALERSWGREQLLPALERATRFRRFKAQGIRYILAAGLVAPNPAPPGKTLNLQLPDVPFRPLSAYALEEVR
jgi:catechol 2,3-dioxygenase-like lactoylglutathione lyase family enzyme